MILPKRPKKMTERERLKQHLVIQGLSDMEIERRLDEIEETP